MIFLRSTDQISSPAQPTRGSGGAL